MRRIIHNSTAIAATLALIVPQVGWAEMRIPDATAEQQGPARGNDMPDLQATLQAELDSGLTADGLACADGAERPCADDVYLMTPEGVVVEVADSGAIILAPSAQQGGIVAEAATTAAEAEAAAETAVTEAEDAAATAADEAETAIEDAASETEAAAANVEAELEADAETAAEDAKDAATEVATEAETAVEDAAQDVDAAADDAEAAVEDAATEGEQAVADEIEAATEEAPADGTDADALAAALAAEQAAAEDAADAVAATEDAAPEIGTPETEAAKAAAAEETAPVVAAMSEDAPAADAEIIEETVTEDNSRSSAEDFEASLRDALAAAGAATGTTQQQDQVAARSSGSSDLTKALVLGLGAVAVGTMLNNNRQVALSTPDRVIVQRPDGSHEVIKDEVVLLRQPGSTVTTENFDDGSSRTIVTRPDGSRVVTIRDADLRVLRRTLISADGTTTQLIDDTATVEPVNLSALPPAARPVVVSSSGTMTEDELRAALAAEAAVNRSFSLSQIRNIPEVRALVAPVDISAITFDTGSAAIKPDQARQLSSLGKVIGDAVKANPREIFMIEGHTDTVGSAASNLALSDRRAESVALALSEYFQVPPENMVVQGYGEQFLKVRQEGDIRENRRASVRRITDLLHSASN